MDNTTTPRAQQWRRLKSWQIALYNIGGVLMVCGALAYAVTAWRGWSWLPYSLGVLGYAGMQLYASYEGADLVLKRLRRQQILSSCLLLLSALAQVVAHFRLWALLSGNTWLMLLLLATIFQVYTTFRISAVSKSSV